MNPSQVFNLDSSDRGFKFRLSSTRARIDSDWKLGSDSFGLSQIDFQPMFIKRDLSEWLKFIQIQFYSKTFPGNLVLILV